MTNDFDLSSGAGTDTDTGSIAPYIDHPTVHVEYPDGDTEAVAPDYDLFLATNAPEELGVAFDETRVFRLEYTERAFGDPGDEFDKSQLQQDIGAAVGAFETEYGYPQTDVCVELAYFRTVGRYRELCIQLRGREGESSLLTQFGLHIDDHLQKDL